MQYCQTRFIYNTIYIYNAHNVYNIHNINSICNVYAYVMWTKSEFCLCVSVCVCVWVGGGGEGVLGGNLSPYRYKASPPPHRPILSVTHRTQPSNSQPPQQQGCRFFLLSQNHPSNLFGLKAIRSDPALYSTNFAQR